ncbi:MAG: metal-dependent hydrolase [Flavobacteriaceae bacterium]|nr:metal-dependent hydrolase [Flavobacteriaceae bacterium]
MDSLTQIVLGASVGEVVLGKKIGNRAPFYGAIAGTIPDLDVLTGYFLDPVTAVEVHRGFSHSIVFCILFAPLFGYLLSFFESKANWKELSWLMFWGLFTHPLLDAFTTWGTQFFWPLEINLAFKSVFVIDPLYTLPFLFCLVMAMRKPKSSTLRRKWNYWGIGLSSTYLLMGLVLKFFSYQAFENALEEQHINYIEIQNRPAPLTTLLWSANVKTEDGFYIGDYSFFDTENINFRFFPKNHHLAEAVIHENDVKRLQKISEGWYTFSVDEDEKLFFNDLRFGLLSFDADENRFVFSYRLYYKEDEFQVEEFRKTPDDGKALIFQLWERIKGN